MKSSYIAVSYQCNHACVMCPLSEKDRLRHALSLQQVLESLDRAALTAGDHVTLSGGEPTMCSFLMDLIEELVRRGIRITLLTNGTGFGDSQITDRLAHLTAGYPFNAVIALHSADERVHDAMTGHPGSLRDSVHAIQNLCRSGVNVTLKHILCRNTLSGLGDLCRMIAALVPPSVEVQFTSMDYVGRARDHFELLYVTFDEIRGPFNEALNILLHQVSQPYRISLVEMPLCACSPEYWGHIRLLSDIDIYLAPNVNTADKVISRLPRECAPQYMPCMKCDVRSICPGTWRSAYELMGPCLLSPVRCSYQKCESNQMPDHHTYQRKDDNNERQSG